MTQQQLLFAELRDTFARRLTNHLNNVFVHQVTGSHTYLQSISQAVRGGDAVPRCISTSC